MTVSEWWWWNQVPVTLGNLLGGLVFTGLGLYLTHSAHAAPAPTPSVMPGLAEVAAE